MMIYFELFWHFCQISFLGFGGGYAVLPLIQEQVVNTNPWLTASEFSDLVTISQMTPGPIIINCATFVGSKVAGIPGAIIATLGVITPSCIIVFILAKIFFKYRDLSAVKNSLRVMRPAVVGLIASASLVILLSVIIPVGTVDMVGVAITAAAFVAIWWLKQKPILVIIAGGLLSVGLYCIGI